jgi:hypothetical protein
VILTGQKLEELGEVMSDEDKGAILVGVVILFCVACWIASVYELFHG